MSQKARSHPQVVEGELKAWWLAHTTNSVLPVAKSGRLMTKQQRIFAVKQVVKKHGYASLDDYNEAFLAAVRSGSR